MHALRQRTKELARGPEAATWIEQQLAVIERQGGRLARLVNEMLDISRLEGRRLEVKLMERARKAADTEEQPASRKGRPRSG